jgi:hypothetical protein
VEEVSRVSVVSAVRVGGWLGALLGLAAGVIYSIGGAAVDTLVSLGWVETNETPGLSVGTLLAFGALVGMPAIGVAVGLVCGGALAFLYNAVASRVGGLKIQLRR